MVNFSPHTSCIIYNSTDHHRPKFIIWKISFERGRESQWRKKNQMGLSFFFFLLFWFHLVYEKKLFSCLDCALHFLAVEIKKIESVRKKEKVRKEEKIFFLFNQMIILSEKNCLKMPQFSLYQENYCNNFKKKIEEFCFQRIYWSSFSGFALKKMTSATLLKMLLAVSCGPTAHLDGIWHLAFVGLVLGLSRYSRIQNKAQVHWPR